MIKLVKSVPNDQETCRGMFQLLKLAHLKLSLALFSSGTQKTNYFEMTCYVERDKDTVCSTKIQDIFQKCLF